MFTRPNSLLIGKDIARTLAVVDGAAMDVLEANIVEGEIVILDKYFKVADTPTYTATETIYIAEGSADIYNYTNEAGTSVTGARKLTVSAPIQGQKVIEVAGGSYTAKTEQVTTIAAISDTVVAGTEYVLRIVYKDVVEHPGQFTQTYRYIAKSGDDSTAVFNGLRARIAKHKGARIAGSGTTTLILTGKAIPEYTSKVDSIDEFDMVQFDVFFNYVDSDYQWVEVGLAADIINTRVEFGVGTWEQVRDMEKFANGYRGITNNTWFPIAKPEFRTIKNETYDLITLVYDNVYTTPNNQYDAQTKLVTTVALPDGASQTTEVLAAINAWIATLPKPFAAITL
jgi:hypothetical protein